MELAEPFISALKDAQVAAKGHSRHSFRQAQAEYYYHLDSTPTHSYMRLLYNYPQAAFPYEQLVATNQKRSRNEPEFELIDTGISEGDRYFDVVVDYAKAAPEDVLIRITVHNRGPEAKSVHVLPTLWFRNTWSWSEGGPRPELRAGQGMIAARHAELGECFLHCGEVPDEASAARAGKVPRLLFTENETNKRRIWNHPIRDCA